MTPDATTQQAAAPAEPTACDESRCGDFQTRAAPGGPVQALRVHLYGTQGSGSSFPAEKERQLIREVDEIEVLVRVMEDLARRAGPDGRLNSSVEEVIGGPVNRRQLKQYRRRLDLPELRMYGGWTTCVHVETSDGYDLVFDCGSGFRNCAAALQEKWGDRPERHAYIFGSHSHLDHTEGFDQAPLCFDKRNTLHIYGNRQFLRALDANLGIFTHEVAAELRGVQTPIFYALMPATFEAHEIRDFGASGHGAGAPPEPDAMVRHFHHLHDPIQIGATTIRPFEVFHPAPCLAYRVEHGGKVFVFCTDHELRRGEDPDHPNQRASLAVERRLVEHATGSDLLYRDGQYLRAEYDGLQGIGASQPVRRLDWGHSCIEDVVDMARACNVRRTLIGHHDPNREWAERNWLDETLIRSCQGDGAVVALAQAESVLDL